MGGKGSGGYRAGAGRKAHSARVIRMRGGELGAVVRPILAPAHVDRPEELPADVERVWSELAPHAIKAGTLVASTAPAFLRLCQAVVKHAQMEAQITSDGLTYLKVTIDGAGQEHQELKAHPLISRAAALDNAIRSWFKDFAINPFGKPLAEAMPKQADPFEEFEAVN